jgi:hypothetical protein
VSSGIDYSFGGSAYGFLEYHFNGAGFSDVAEYASAVSQSAYSEGAVYLLGRHYVTPGLSYQLSPLLTGTTEVMANLSDLSFSFSPHLEYSVAEDVYLAVGAHIGIGDSPLPTAVEGLPPRFEFKSEFGTYPNMYYTSFTLYF